MRISNKQPHKISTELDYQITQLQREIEWLLFKDKQKKIVHLLMLKRKYQEQKQQKPPKN